MKEINLGDGDETCIGALLQRFNEDISKYSLLPRNRHIVKYYASFVFEGTLFILMELMLSGSVRQYIDRSGPLRPTVMQRYSKQTLCGLTFLHQLKIAHLDLRCCNLLRDQNGRIKITDFGCSKMLGDICTAGGSRLPTSAHHM